MGHAQAHRMPIRARYRLVLCTGLRPPSRPPCRTAASSFARRHRAPCQRQGSFGFGYRRPAATASPLVICAGLQPAKGACRAALLSAAIASFARFSLCSWLFLQKSAPSLPRLPAVFIKPIRITLRFMSTSPLQSFPVHSRHRCGRRPTGQELSKKR